MKFETLGSPARGAAEDNVNTQPPTPEGDSPDRLPPATPEPGGIAEPVRWGRLVKALGAIGRVVTSILAVICIVLFVWLVFVVTWQVFTRQVIRNSAPWTTEAATYSLVALGVIAIAYVYSERGHIAVEMFVEKLPPRAQKVQGVIIELVVVFFTVFVFVWGGSRVAVNAWDQSMAILPMTVGQVYLVLPIAGVLIVFYALTHIVGILAGAAKPLPDFDENAEAI